MSDLKEFTPSTKQNPKPEKPADIVSNEEFQRKSAEKEAERREKNPLDISEIFDLIRDGKLTKEKLNDFELGQELTAALKWAIDLNERLKKTETTVSDQRAAIDQMELAIKEREAAIEHLKKIIADMEEKFPPLGGA